jgi:effector-binding domain-containing protein
MHKQKNTIDRPSLKLVQLLPFLKDKALATNDMEVTHLGCATVHQLVTGFLLMHSEVDPVRNIACGIHRLSPEPSRSPMLIKHHPSHLTQGSVFSFPQHHSEEAYTDSKTGVQDPSHGKRFQNESF